MNARDVRMVERGKQLRLTFEPRETLGVVSEVLGEDLDRDVTPELGVAGSLDLSHPARTNGRDDLVDAEQASGRKHHGDDSVTNFTYGKHAQKHIVIDVSYYQLGHLAPFGYQ